MRGHMAKKAKKAKKAKSAVKKTRKVSHRRVKDPFPGGDPFDLGVTEETRGTGPRIRKK